MAAVYRSSHSASSQRVFEGDIFLPEPYNGMGGYAGTQQGGEVVPWHVRVSQLDDLLDGRVCARGTTVLEDVTREAAITPLSINAMMAQPGSAMCRQSLNLQRPRCGRNST